MFHADDTVREFIFPAFHVSLDLTERRDANAETPRESPSWAESVWIGLAVLAWSPLFKGAEVVETGPRAGARTILLPIESSTCRSNVVLIRGLALSTKTEYYCLPSCFRQYLNLHRSNERLNTYQTVLKTCPLLTYYVYRGAREVSIMKDISLQGWLCEPAWMTLIQWHVCLTLAVVGSIISAFSNLF